ncbi:MAG: M2 family metallopeptidase [bacterium]|nr:M2 family metallopeptidase [bacterium]
MELQTKVAEFLDKYQSDYAKAYKEQATSYWKAANSGNKEDFDAYAAADLELKQLHGDPERYAMITGFLARKDELKPLTIRALSLAELAFKGNQLPKDLLEKMVTMSANIEELFNNFRGSMDKNEYSNNEILEMIKKERRSPDRKRMWETLKQVGDVVGPKLIELAKVRNEAAAQLGFGNYWEMEIRLQEHDPEQIIAIFDELERETNEPFKVMKSKLDRELVDRFNIDMEEIMPWHYNNPFFQAAPASGEVNLDEFYGGRTKEEILRLAEEFFADMGMPVEDISARSDLYEREGKHQHAFCISLDYEGDTRVLENIKPTSDWMATTLHEMGHGVYYKYSDFSLPFNLREAAHIFITEAIAMLFGGLARNGTWMVTYAGVDEAKVGQLEGAILEQRRSEQLIFARWTLVMLNFERALYEDPGQDLNTLWWDMVERYQMLNRPVGRDAADWAAKPHFTIAPVYYHNYMLGEIFAAQLRNTLVGLVGHKGPVHRLDYSVHKGFGDYFKEKIFKPCSRVPWPEFIKNATGEPLTSTYFAKELK